MSWITDEYVRGIMQCDEESDPGQVPTPVWWASAGDDWIRPWERYQASYIAQYGEEDIPMDEDT